MCSTSKDVRLSRVRAQGASLHLPSGWEEDGRKEGGMALGGVDGVGRRQEISQWHQGPWLSVISPTRCLICMPYMYALYVCLICMPYMHALYVCLICMPYMYALYVCHIYIYLCIYIYTYTYIYIYICIYIPHVFMQICMCVYVCVCMYVCMYVYNLLHHAAHIH